MTDILRAASPYELAPARNVDIVGDAGKNDRNSLLQGSKFGYGDPGEPLVVTYSFATNGSVWPDIEFYPFGGVEALTPAQQEAARSALDAWSAVANVDFVEVDETVERVGVMRFARSGDIQATGLGFYPNDGVQSGDVWLDDDVPSDPGSLDPGSAAYFVLLHEIGHALGLKHPHDGPITASFGEDWTGGTVMAYRTFPGQYLEDDRAADIFPAAPMALDVEAIRYLYGARPVATGNDVYRFAHNERVFETLVDDGGSDLLDWSNQSSDAYIDLRQGNWSDLGQPYSWPETTYDWGGTFTGTLRTAVGTIIERAMGGSGQDWIVGNGADNALYGMAGGDAIDGGIGNDLLVGGTGDDWLVGDVGNDRLVGQEGEDYLKGGDGADDLGGGTLGDVLDGGSGDDTLFGAEGDDRIGGGVGDDIVHGSAGQDILTGGAGDDIVGGGAGDDLVNGGSGNDRLTGGTGRDRFVMEADTNATDRITDFIPGIDHILLRGGYTSSQFLEAANVVGGSTQFDLPNGHDVLVVGVVGARLDWFVS